MNAIFHITSSEEASAAARVGFYVPKAFAVDGFMRASVESPTPRLSLNSDLGWTPREAAQRTSTVIRNTGFWPVWRIEIAA